MCTSAEQLDYVMNAYYDLNSKASTACDFSGSGTIKTASTASSCSTLLAEAGTSGTGTVTSLATGTAASDSSSSSAAASSSKAAAGHVTAGFVDTGFLSLSLYAVVAMVTGAGMLLL